MKKLTDNQLHLALVFAPIVAGILMIIVIESLDDPATIAASKGQKEVEFTRLTESQRVYRMWNRASGQRTYFTLSRYSQEQLVAPVRKTDCEIAIPAWIQRFPKAHSDSCIALTTNAGERRSWSFLLPFQDTKAAYEFYQRTLTDAAKLSELASGMLPTSSLDINAVISYRDADGVTRLTMDYYRVSPSDQTVVIVEY